MYKKVQVWIAAGASHDEIQFLVFKVLPERGNGWHPVTGSVEKNESLMEAAQRETQEETSLTAAFPFWFDLNYSFTFIGRWGEAEEHAFGVWIQKPITELSVQLDPNEHTEAKWVGAAEVRKLIQLPDQRNAFEIFYGKLTSKASSP